METQHTYLALLVPAETEEREAAEIVRRSLAERGLSPWPAMEIELYPGSGGCLLIARPAKGEKVYITKFALRWLTKRGRAADAE